jgi:hypothetical protein
MPSLSFLGNATSYLRIPNTNDFDFGTGDFTIEWYQYQRDSNSFPRIFQVGNYGAGALSIGVSIEGGRFYYWTNNTPNLATTLTSSSYKNKWVHFAISRSSGVTKIFKNGVSFFSMNDTNNFNGTNDLVISNESTPANNSAFGGYITYFTWVKGVSLYTTNFTVSSTPPSLTSNYVLLLTSASFDGTLGSTVVNSNVSNVPDVPSDPSSDNNQSTQDTQPTIKSIFSNNSLVFYKTGSLASCGVGSVRNSSTKSRRI